jgi:hypothetical protein
MTSPAWFYTRASSLRARADELEERANKLRKEADEAERIAEELSRDIGRRDVAERKKRR